MWSHITALFRQHPDAESVEPYRFHWNGVSLSSVTALTTVLLKERGSLVLGFVGSLPFFNRCLNLLTAKPANSENYGTSLSTMFWHISFSWKALAKMTWICKYVWAALKHHLWRHLLFSKIWFDDDDKSNDNSCYCSGNYEYFVISSFTSLFYCILFLCLPAAYYFTYIFLFILRPPLHWNSWWCPRGLIYPQVHSHTTHDFFLYCLGQIYSSFPQVQCQWNQVTSTDLCNYRKSRALISIMPWYIF